MLDRLGNFEFPRHRVLVRICFVFLPILTTLEAHMVPFRSIWFLPGTDLHNRNMAFSGIHRLL